VSYNDIVVTPKATADEVIFGPTNLQQAVAEARRLAESNPGRSFAVRNKRGVIFNCYPDADIQFEEYRRLGLVPADA
jgi:hypothetical protein